MKRIEFKQKFALENGAVLDSENWKKVIAISTKPNTINGNIPEIEAAKKKDGKYYNLYHLEKEAEGFIFREVYARHGICGHHDTPEAAIFNALFSNHIKVFLES